MYVLFILGFGATGFGAPTPGKSVHSVLSTHTFVCRRSKNQSTMLSPRATGHSGPSQERGHTGSVHRAFETRLPQRGEPGVFKKTPGVALWSSARRGLHLKLHILCSVGAGPHHGGGTGGGGDTAEQPVRRNAPSAPPPPPPLPHPPPQPLLSDRGRAGHDDAKRYGTLWADTVVRYCQLTALARRWAGRNTSRQGCSDCSCCKCDARSRREERGDERENDLRSAILLPSSCLFLALIPLSLLLPLLEPLSCCPLLLCLPTLAHEDP